MIPRIDRSDFEATVLGSPVPVLLDASTRWCPPCRALEPILEQLLAAGGGRYRIVEFDAEQWPELAARLAVRAFPTVMVFHQGREVARHVGLTTAKRLRGMLDAAAPQGHAPG